jgi:aryl-alcohol dehydrogenase-like predicted oxidoreductase
MSDRTIPHLGRFRPAIALGSLAFGDGAESEAVLDAYRAAGGRLLDLALVYGDGASERIVGEWLHARGCRQEMVLLAKGAHPPRCDPDLVGAEVERSLELLGTDRLDCFVLHRDRPDLPVQAWADALMAAHAAGTVTTFGVSNWTTARTLELAEACDGRLVLSSNHLSLARMREAPWDGCLAFDGADLDELRAAGIVLVPWSTLAGGYFAGRDARNELVRNAWATPGNAARRERAGELGARRGVDAVTVALAYVLSFEAVIPAVGASTPAQLAALLAAEQVELSADERRWLESGA